MGLASHLLFVTEKIFFGGHSELANSNMIFRVWVFELRLTLPLTLFLTAEVEGWGTRASVAGWWNHPSGSCFGGKGSAPNGTQEKKQSSRESNIEKDLWTSEFALNNDNGIHLLFLRPVTLKRNKDDNNRQESINSDYLEREQGVKVLSKAPDRLSEARWLKLLLL